MKIFNPTDDWVVRFWEKVDQSDVDGCWIWTAATNKRGYGKVGWQKPFKGMMGAHRAAFLLSGGVLPDEKPHVLHSCHTPACVRPDHLHAGTHLENIREMIEAGRRQRSNAKLSLEQVEEIKADRAANGFSHLYYANKYSVSKTTIGYYLCPTSRKNRGT